MPNLKALNLNDNKISFPQSLTGVAKILPLLNILHLENNCVKKIQDLSGLKELNLKELDIRGNPLYEVQTLKHNLFNELCAMFPNLEKICNTELEKGKLPTPTEENTNSIVLKTRQIFTSSYETKESCQEFMDNYFKWFDENRGPPANQFYHENAQFSLVAIDG